MDQRDIEILTKKLNKNTDEIKKMFENIKYIFEKVANKTRDMVKQPSMQLVIKMAIDKELNHYSYMYERVKTKRLKKKYKKKFDKRLKEIKGNLK